MCNFIIRPVEAVASIDLPQFDIKEGDKVKVLYVSTDGVVISKPEVTIPLEIYIHTFTLPKKEEKKK